MDLAFTVDLCINFCLIYEDHMGRRVQEYGRIARHYLRTWFAIDFVSILPFDILGFFFDASDVSQLRILRTIRLLRLLKLCLLYTSPSPRDKRQSRMPSSA